MGAVEYSVDRGGWVLTLETESVFSLNTTSRLYGYIAVTGERTKCIAVHASKAWQRYHHVSTAASARSSRLSGQVRCEVRHGLT